MAMSPPSGAALLPDYLAVTLEFLPWQDLGAAFAAVCPAWRGAAAAPGAWEAKHAQHFGWASERLAAAGAALGSAAAFRDLRRVQREALAGDSVDVLGRWLGKDLYQQGGVFHFRLTVRAGEAGEALWRGAPSEAPFHTDLHTIPDDFLCRLAALPVAERCSNGRSAAEACRARAVELGGDERAVGGYIQWFVGESSDPEMLNRMQEHARARFGLETVLQRRSLEYVCGLFLPAARRLVLAGTHISHTGFGVLGLDQYDLALAPDGLSLEGTTRGHHTPAPGQWLNEFRAESVALPSPPGSAAASGGGGGGGGGAPAAAAAAEAAAAAYARDADELRRHDP